MANPTKLEPCYLIPDNPLKEIEAKDPFQFKPFVETIAALAMTNKNKTPFTIVIDGPWGSGKTTLMEMTRSILDEKKESFKKEGDKENQRPCKTFWFNAWKYSNDEHLLNSLLLTIFKEMESDTGFWEAIKTKIDGKSFFSGIINKYAGQFTGGDVNEYMHELRLRKNSAFLDEFVELVKMLIRSFCSDKKDEDKKGAFVIFIDDLDRCPPGRVLQVLEAVKLFLDIPGCVFVIGMAVEQVETAIQTEYVINQKRENFNANQYLEKIIQIHVRIPPIGLENKATYLEELFGQITTFKDPKYNEVKKVFLSAELDTQRAMKRKLNDYLFLESICERMEDVELI
jgi:predicted KAP-like P-loop ATPase